MHRFGSASGETAGMVIVRRARAADLDAVCELLAQLPIDGRAAIPADAAGRVFDAILRQRGRSLLVAESDGTVVGTADLVIVANLTHGCRSFGLVENVVVAPDARRHGIGRALMERVVSDAQAAGCYKVQLLSNTERTDAHDFYAAIGFELRAAGFRRYF